MKNRIMTALFYIVITCASVAMFIDANAYATRSRGYAGVGGEIIFLLMPVFVYIIPHVISDTIEYLGGQEEWKQDKH